MIAQGGMNGEAGDALGLVGWQLDEVGQRWNWGCTEPEDALPLTSPGYLRY
jgi:hypothetical protein